MAELKPCPFCGGKPQLVKWGNEWSVECCNNGCGVMPETPLYVMQTEAVITWNRRAGDGNG